MKARLMSMLSMAATALSLLLAGCQSTGVTVPPGGQDLERCDFARVVDVEDLKEMGRPGCDMAGTTIRFPDGATAAVGSIGATNSSSYDAAPGDAEIPIHF